MNLEKFHDLNFFPSSLLYLKQAPPPTATRTTRTTTQGAATGTATITKTTTSPCTHNTTTRKVGLNDMPCRSGPLRYVLLLYFITNIYLLQLSTTTRQYATTERTGESRPERRDMSFGLRYV
jgi:hypothetical protein